MRLRASSSDMTGLAFALALGFGATTSVCSVACCCSQSRDIVPTQRSPSGSVDASSSIGAGAAGMTGEAADDSSRDSNSSSSGAGVVSSTDAVTGVRGAVGSGVQKPRTNLSAVFSALGHTGIGSGCRLTEFFFQPRFLASNPPRRSARELLRRWRGNGWLRRP